MSPYEKACKNALDVQDACNFSGVLKSFAQDMEAVRAHLNEEGTYDSRAFAMHLVALLYIDKLADLQRRPEDSILFDAFEKLRAVVEDARQLELDQERAERRLPNC